MRTYKIVNDVMGWVVFAIAAFTYCSTIEPTASFWDCPEFITTASKLEVGHPPGAPFFMLFGNFFSQFASDSTQIAKMINIMSALLSAGCILFLFWSVTHLARKLVCEDGEDISLAKTIAIMASGVAGSLIYTWSDTFWFSAVEGEVYAFSSFCTALVFWLILKWEDNADAPGSDKWLVLIAYLVGLSIGVHLLNLLCIPAIVLVFYYKKAKDPDLKGSLTVLAISMVIVAAVLYGIVPGIVKIGGVFELLFVNGLGMSFNSGLYVYIFLLVVSLVWALYETTAQRSKMLMNVSYLISVALLGIPFYGHGTTSVVIGFIVLAVIGAVLFMKEVSARIMNTSLLCMTLIVVGYSTYAVIVVRSTANPPMDQNSPEDIFTLGEYLSREQYGDRPLFWGPTYASQPEIIQDGDMLKYNTNKTAKVYQRKEKASETEADSYEMIREKFDYVYPSNQCLLLPRIYDESKAGLYEQWLGGVDKKEVMMSVPGQEPRTVSIPTQYDNIRFFFSYQLNFMYWRYFLWNFAGRQNDLQGNGELEHGNWLTGFSFLDDSRLGPQDRLPSELQENKGHNVFYCLPLILGLIGFFWQAFKDKKGIQQFWVVFFLFFMTGIAIVLYLNQTPAQPRERDYAYAGSFYAFSIWCGLGILAIYCALENLLKKNLDVRMATLGAALVSLVPAVAVPLQMVSQTWDDHDRSDRYMCRDFGLNYLETIPQDGVIYTNGDNDTFPLWYNEDTEGNRTDVRVCNLSYLQTDWYIDQMKRPAFEGEGMSSPLPIGWKRIDYVSGTNEAVDVNPVLNEEGLTVKDFILTYYSISPDVARRIWGDDPFELHNAIHKFVLKEGFEDLPEEYKYIVEKLPKCLPSDTLHITIDKKAVKKSGMMITDSIPDKMDIALSDQGGRVYKSFIMMLEMLAESNFSRPIYMSTTVGESNYGSLYRHFIQEGMAYRISPFTFDIEGAEASPIDTEKMYDNMMNKYHYGNLKQPGLYIDETTMRMCSTHRRWFTVLIKQLIEEGKLDKAKKALAKCETEIPAYNVPYTIYNGSIDIIDAYIACGQYDKAAEVAKQLEKRSREYVLWYVGLATNYFAGNVGKCQTELSVLARLADTYEDLSKKQNFKQRSEMKQRSDKLFEDVQTMYAAFSGKAQEAGLGR